MLQLGRPLRPYFKRLHASKNHLREFHIETLRPEDEKGQMAVHCFYTLVFLTPAPSARFA